MATYSIRMIIAALQDMQELGNSALTDKELMSIVESLVPRSPTLRAAVEPDTTDALHATIQHLFDLGYIHNYGSLEEVERILRDRLARG